MGNARRIALAFSAVALLHSVLASRAAKRAAARLVGERNRNAFYRPFYLAQSVVSFGGFLVYLGRMPNRVVWKTGLATAVLFNTARGAALVAMVSAVNQIGWDRLLGFRGLKVWRAGGNEVPPEPEAQGPNLDCGAPITGPFCYSRHPLNFLGLPSIWLRPTITRNWLSFNVLASAYFILGSWHEEQRLRAAYGDKYPPTACKGRSLEWSWACWHYCLAGGNTPS
jgi:methanethiol S-methyltransferase